MKWEYRLFQAGLDREDRAIQEALNNLGPDEWELVAVYESGFRVFVLKRPLASSPPK
jgi:hypothetical protein